MRLKKIKKDEKMNAMKRTPDPETATLVNFCYPSRNSLCVCVFISKILCVCLNSQVFTWIRKRVAEGLENQEYRPLSSFYVGKPTGTGSRPLPWACTLLGEVLLSLFLFYKKTETVNVFVCICVCAYKLCFSNKNGSLHLHYSFCFWKTVYLFYYWQPTPVFLPGEFHGQRSLAGYSPWHDKELETTEWIT